MSRGVIELLELAGAVVFAIPVAFFGLLMFIEGRPLLGVVFLLLAGLMTLGKEYVPTPQDIPAAALGGLVGRIAKDPDEEE